MCIRDSSEGKEYVVKDGDVVLFRFNVWFDFLENSEYEKGVFLKEDYLSEKTYLNKNL